jgi:hypothetical protein
MSKKKKSIAEQLIKSLSEFTKKLEKGEEIEATQIVRADTPDGPMHIRRRKILKRRKP